MCVRVHARSVLGVSLNRFLKSETLWGDPRSVVLLMIIKYNFCSFIHLPLDWFFPCTEESSVTAHARACCVSLNDFFQFLVEKYSGTGRLNALGFQILHNMKLPATFTSHT